MKNKDAIAKEKAKIVEKMNQSIMDGDTEAFAKALEDLCLNVQEGTLLDAEEVIAEMNGKNDVTILASRGVRQLTSEEKTYYEKVIEAMRSPNPKQALTEVDVVMPKTTIEAIFEDLIQNHELLNAIDFQNTLSLIEILINVDDGQLASWSTLTSDIVKELSSGFKKVKMGMNKLSAFMPVSKAMLDLGPEWMDKYVRTLLQEAIYNGLEKAIINGTGNEEPIGMMREVGDDVTVTGKVYPEKAAKKVTNLDPTTYGGLLAGMSKNPKGKTREIKNVIMVVNTTDYFNKIMPATTFLTPQGSYVNNILPYPTKIIQSIHVPEGKAVIGLGHRYFAGLGTEKSGRIEYSDEYRFLEDERVYLTKLYGHGEPLDNNAFIVLDISELKSITMKVTTVPGE